MIEKHFTLNKKMRGPDHLASLNEKELIEFIKSIRLTEKILGGQEKKVQPEEMQMRKISRKSARYNDNFKLGKKITFKDFDFLRPGNGINGSRLKIFLNRKLKKNVKKNQLIKVSDFEWFMFQQVVLNYVLLMQ